MEFSPDNQIVKLCLQGMALEDQEKYLEALILFLKALDKAQDDFERFLAAHFIARSQDDPQDKMEWLQSALKFALKVDDEGVSSALPGLYDRIAACHKALGDEEQALKSQVIADSYRLNPTDKGPFYHGTRADLKEGDLLKAGFNSNYKSDLRMNHIYFTALVNSAGLAAAFAKGDGPERVYIVEPTGQFENDPNVTDKKFPGNPTRSYRSESPLKVVGEAHDWLRQTPEQIQKWREKLAKNDGKIIN